MEEIEFPQLTTLMKNMYELKERLSDEIAKGFASFLATFELYEEMGHIIDWTILLKEAKNNNKNGNGSGEDIN